jgi:hypothetical protein
MHGNEHEFWTVRGLGVWLLAMLGAMSLNFVSYVLVKQRFSRNTTEKYAVVP